MKQCPCAAGAVILALVLFVTADVAYAKAAKEVDASVSVALDSFKQGISNGSELLQKAKGVLVFPDLVKAGIGLGGEYGEGALMVNGKTADYYSSVGGSFGLQLGGQSRRIFLLFMEDSALKSFREASGWTGALNASGVFLKHGAEAMATTITSGNKPVMVFVLDQKGLMYDLNFEVVKYDRLKK